MRTENKSRRRKDRKGERGASMVEGALALIPFMAILAGTVNVSLNFFLADALQDRAYQAVRYAALHPGDAQGVRTMMLYGSADYKPSDEESALPSPTYLGINESDVFYERHNVGTPAETVTVGVQDYKLPLLIPGFAKELVGKPISATIPVESP